MPLPLVSTHFADQCAVVIGTQNNTAGDVTRASIDHLSVTDLNAIFQPGGLFADLDAWFIHAVEMKACGVRRYCFYDWIMANADRHMFREQYQRGLKGQTGVKVIGLLHPFIFGRQESVINRHYWKVVNGTVVGSYSFNAATAVGTITSGPISDETGGTHIIRVQNRHGIPMDANEFRASEVVHVFTRAGNGVLEGGQWKVIRAATDTALTYIDLLVTSENAGSTTPFRVPAAGAYVGLIIPGINNINDFEKWCQNLPTYDPRKRVPFWWQVRRTARKVDEEYERVFQKLFETNPAFREFGDLPLAEKNAQDELEDQKRFVNAFLFQKKISANQTLTLWESLESINTPNGDVIHPGMDGKLVAKRANFVGVKEQLRECDQVYDVQGNPLNLYELLNHCYDLKRAYSTANRKITHLFFWTNSVFRAHFQTAMMEYYNDQYKGILRITTDVMKIGQVAENLGWVYDTYHVKHPAGVQIGIIVDEFFDDYYDEMLAVGLGDAGNLLLHLDIGLPPNGSVYWAQIAANRKAYTTAQIDQLAKIDQTFFCVMEKLTERVTLTSETGAVVVECPRLSRWIENFKMEKPVSTGQTPTSYINLY